MHRRRDRSDRVEAVVLVRDKASRRRARRAAEGRRSVGDLALRVAVSVAVEVLVVELTGPGGARRADAHADEARLRARRAGSVGGVARAVAADVIGGGAVAALALRDRCARGAVGDLGLAGARCHVAEVRGQAVRFAGAHLLAAGRAVRTRVRAAFLDAEEAVALAVTRRAPLLGAVSAEHGAARALLARVRAGTLAVAGAGAHVVVRGEAAVGGLEDHAGLVAAVIARIARIAASTVVGAGARVVAGHGERYRRALLVRILAVGNGNAHARHARRIALLAGAAARSIAADAVRAVGRRALVSCRARDAVGLAGRDSAFAAVATVVRQDREVAEQRGACSERLRAEHHESQRSHQDDEPSHPAEDT